MSPSTLRAYCTKLLIRRSRRAVRSGVGNIACTLHTTTTGQHSTEYILQLFYNKQHTIKSHSRATWTLLCFSRQSQTRRRLIWWIWFGSGWIQNHWDLDHQTGSWSEVQHMSVHQLSSDAFIPQPNRWLNCETTDMELVNHVVLLFTLNFHWYSLHLPQVDGQAELTWMVCHTQRWFTCPQGDLSTNPTQCRATKLIKTTTLPLRQTANAPSEQNF